MKAVTTAQAAFDQHQPQVVVGSSRGGAVAMNINIGDAKLVLLCPAWKKWGSAKTVGVGMVILHSRADDVVPFSDNEAVPQCVANCRRRWRGGDGGFRDCARFDLESRLGTSLQGYP